MRWEYIQIYAYTYAYLPNAVLNLARQGKLRARKNKEYVHALKSCVCVLTSLPEDSEKEYTVKVVIFARSYFRDLPILNCFACF